MQNYTFDLLHISFQADLNESLCLLSWDICLKSAMQEKTICYNIYFYFYIFTALLGCLKPSICVMFKFSKHLLLIQCSNWEKGKIFVWKIKISLKRLHLVYFFLSQTNKAILIQCSNWEKGKFFVWKIKILLKRLLLVYFFLSQTDKAIVISIWDLFDRRATRKISI